jgi:poly-gamma-glutamate synthesis protein (capsule biosynthesis protein)
MKRYWKILIPLLFALAIALGLLQRQDNPYVGFRKQTFYFNQNNSDKSLEDYFGESQKLAKQNQPVITSFLAVGDIMLSRNVAAEIFKSTDNGLPFRRMADILKSTDFNFANLESPFYPPKQPCATGGATGIVGGHSLIFGAPCDTVHGLPDNNFKILNLANNHTLDQGLNGLEFTRSLLDSNNIKYVGAGKNLDETWQPAIVDANGIKVCFVGASYASINDSGKIKNDYIARIEDIERLKNSIATAKTECDFVVATMHAGAEYTRMPNAAQINFAHAAIDAGADLVIGSHPHWVQNIERYNGKYIFYSLGNFIFDQMWSQETKEGLTLKITLSKNDSCSSLPLHEGELEGVIVGIDSSAKPSTTSPNPSSRGREYCTDNLQGSRIPAKLDKIELIPVIIENYSTPRPANEEETKRILEKINQKEKLLYESHVPLD